MRLAHDKRRVAACLLVSVGLALAACTPGAGEPEEGGSVQLSIISNVAEGGKNSLGARWLLDFVIPSFERQMRQDGVDANVRLIPLGVADEDYKSRIALDLRVGEGADIMGFDQFWLAEFVAAGYLQPLDEVVGEHVNDWEGWDQIPEAVQGSLVLDDETYGIPLGTDGRVLFYNKQLFRRAGLPVDWQPTSWDEIIDAGRRLKQRLPGVTPLQFNAGVAMGEATTLQGFVPILLGTGTSVYDQEIGKWIGDTPELRDALKFFDTIYAEGLADAQLQLRADGRDRSFQQFSQGRIAVLAESDYFWRDVISPNADLFPMEDRDQVVGWAKIPAQEPGSGYRRQDFVSASGGTGHVLNPNSEHPEDAWALLSFMGSEEAQLELTRLEPRITAREDVNERVLDDDPLLRFIAEEILPITWFRPGFEEYPQASIAVTEMVEDVVADRASVEEAAEQYTSELTRLVEEDEVQTGSF